MSIVVSEANRPLSSGEFQITDIERADDIDRKQQRVAEFLKEHQYDALLLQRPANFAWFTSGASCPQVGPTDTTASLLITPDARVVVTNNIDSGELFDKELPGLGFLLKERPWHEPRHILIDDLCRGRKVASDSGYGATTDESEQIAAWRIRLAPIECGRFRALGRLVAHAVEATARNIAPGQTEAEIAGHLAHRMIKQEVFPLGLKVLADGRAKQYRHWTYQNTPVRRWCTIAAAGIQKGLSCAVARTVCFGNPSDELSSAFQKSSMLAATGMFFSQVGSPLTVVWDKVRRIYEKVGHAEEWQLCEQADVIGYQLREMALLPKNDFVIAPRMGIYWHPSVGPCQAGDTILTTEQGPELITPAEQWPTFRVAVKGNAIVMPDILCREAVEPA